MKQYPKMLKYKKNHKSASSYLYKTEEKEFYLSFGEYGLQSLESCKIKFQQIEACRKTIKRGVKKLGFMWIKLFTNIPIYKKSLNSRMGKGKGALKYWICRISKGQVFFEISGLSYLKALNILNKAKSKLPLKTKIIKIRY
jgi:large subunit ribosomal protein L16